MSEPDWLSWVALSRIHGLGGQGLCNLLSVFGSPEAIYQASKKQLTEVVSDAVASQICLGIHTQELTSTQDWINTSESNQIITLADDAYPKALLEIHDPPPILYCKGDVGLLNTPSIAVVGSRHATPQGDKNAQDFSETLTQHGFTVVSGMALGIDGAAHRGALRGQGKTIAVVGTGLDIVYPAKHRDLAHQIVTSGLIISEFGIGTPSRPENFPRRNRIISGLSLGCLVVEANVQSGSLITARLSAEQGREVFAIPGSIHSPVAKGCHLLIKQGAKLVDCVQDILDELGSKTNLRLANIEKISTEPHPVLDLMGFDPITMEALVQTSGLTAESLSAMLMVLELESRIATLPGGLYQRIA